MRGYDIRSLLKWCVLLLAAAFFASSLPARSQQKAAEVPPGYVKSESCGVCHEQQYKDFNKSAHYVLEVNPRFKNMERACEACHGPGSEHVEGGGDVAKIFSPKRASAPAINSHCLECHGKQHQRFGYESSLHGQSNLSCTDCHSIHTPKQKVHLLKEKDSALCYTCHKEIRSEFSRPFHHKVNEGGMRCADCHDPHGGLNAAQLKFAAGSQAACVKCHSDKQGPFVFEHASLRLDGGCMSCHTPHGSVNAKMLRRNQVRALCLECHTGTPRILGSQPPAFHDVRSPRYQNCTSCHVRIHGSNVDRLFLR